jgi:hypothetical protein
LPRAFLSGAGRRRPPTADRTDRGRHTYIRQTGCGTSLLLSGVSTGSQHASATPKMIITSGRSGSLGACPHWFCV